MCIIRSRYTCHFQEVPGEKSKSTSATILFPPLVDGQQAPTERRRLSDNAEPECGLHFRRLARSATQSLWLAKTRSISIAARCHLTVSVHQFIHLWGAGIINFFSRESVFQDTTSDRDSAWDCWIVYANLYIGISNAAPISSNCRFSTSKLEHGCEG